MRIYYCGARFWFCFVFSLFFLISCCKENDVFPLSHPTLQQQGRRAELGRGVDID